MPLITFPLNIISILHLFCKTFLRITVLRMGQVWEVTGYRKMRYFNISTAFHSFESRIVPMRSTSVRILYRICCVEQNGRAGGGCSDWRGFWWRAFICEKWMNLSAEQNLAFKNSEGFPSLYLFFYPCVKNKRIMWTYMHFACLQLSCGTITSCWWSDNKIQSSQC